MKKYLYNPPAAIKKLYPCTIWQTECNEILLTFDDGPNERTTVKILDQLDKYGAKAIFFCVGENIERTFDLSKEILKRGHSIGNHTWKHQKITKFSSSELIKELSYFYETVNEKFNYPVEYFRPPRGKIFPHQDRIIAESNLKNVMWSLLTYDYQSNFNKLKFAIDNYLQRNSIVVLHDSMKSNEIIADSIDYIFHSVEKKNFKIGTPQECLK